MVWRTVLRRLVHGRPGYQPMMLLGVLGPLIVWREGLAHWRPALKEYIGNPVLFLFCFLDAV